MYIIDNNRYIRMDIRALLDDRNPWWREPAARLARGMPVRRDLQATVLSHLRRAEQRRAVVVLGPRQTGKSTLLWQTADDLLESGFPPHNLTYFDFSDDRVTEPVTAREVAAVQPVGFDPRMPRVLLLDEVHLAPRWDRWLKQAVDQQAVDQREVRIVVTDSAASLLRDAGRESGVGRWDEHWLEGLSFREFVRLQPSVRGRQDPLEAAPELLERYLVLGGFPEHALSEDFPGVRLRLRSAIVEKAIYRDLAEAVDSPEQLRDLFVVLVQGSGGELVVSNRAADLEKDRRTVQKWVRLLEDTLLLVSLPPRKAKAGEKLRTPVRIYAADHGMIHAFTVSPRADEDLRAQVFEAVVFRHLRQTAREAHGHLSYLRAGRKGLEIDFVLESGGERVGIEVTNSRQIKPRKVERLREAGELIGADRLLVVYGGLTDQDLGGVTAVPLARFLARPAEVLAGGKR
jgi:predicted AAA+ superfamily ATPase